MRQVSFIYGSRVRFYGRLWRRSDLHAEKRRFIQRWPIRRYALRPGTVRVTCAGPNARCTVRGVLDWRTESPRRGAQAHGSSRFVQAFDFSRGRPLIVSEFGSVLEGPAHHWWVNLTPKIRLTYQSPRLRGPARVAVSSAPSLTAVSASVRTPRLLLRLPTPAGHTRRGHSSTQPRPFYGHRQVQVTREASH